jgi:hypothetical protein
MNYLKHYIKLIRIAEKRHKPEEYCESHHVFPVSIFGKNDRVVWLTAREHVIAHLMLFLGCRRRYGPKHYRTYKMAFAAQQMGWKVGQRNYTKNIGIAREFARIANTGENNPSKRPEVRKKISKAKAGITRDDLKGKSYFGADEDTIRAGIEKMRAKKTGMKINYPKDRVSPPCSDEKKAKIQESRLKTKEKYITMSNEEFVEWISQQSLYGPSGRRNPNVTRAITWRGEEVSTYYG